MLGDVNKIPMIFPGSQDIRRNRSKETETPGRTFRGARVDSPSARSLAPER